MFKSKQKAHKELKPSPAAPGTAAAGAGAAEMSGSTESSVQSLVERTFGGKLLNTYKCSKCKTESASIEKFNDIPLAFPDSDKVDKQRKSSRVVKPSNSGTKNGPSPDKIHNDLDNRLTLETMLSNFLSPETLTGDNKYKCDQCRSLQDAERFIHVIDGPDYLVFNLLRFSYNLKSRQRSKIMRDVIYPKTLFVPITEQQQQQLGVAASCVTGSSESVKSSKSRKRSPTSNGDERVEAAQHYDVYGLCAVVVHSGLSSDAGHYYCYARHCVPVAEPQLYKPAENTDYLRDQWVLFNDARVSFSGYESFSEVTQKFAKDTAYLLFYKKLTSCPSGSATSVEFAPTKVPVIAEPTLRKDLLDAVVKDNVRFLQVTCVSF